MKKLSAPTVMKSTCNKGSSYLYTLSLDSPTEAQKIADEIHKVVGLSMPPKIKFSRRQTKRLLGTCWPDGRILLRPPNGQQVGTLLHELAHLHKKAVSEAMSARIRRQRGVSHGFGFKTGLSEIKRVWESIKGKYMPFDAKAWDDGVEALKDGFGISPKLASKLWSTVEKPPVVEKPTEPNWEDMGHAACKAGKKRIPVNDAALMNALNEINKRTYNYSTKNALDLWLKGWDKANLEPVVVTPEPVVFVTKSGFRTVRLV